MTEKLAGPAGKRHKNSYFFTLRKMKQLWQENRARHWVIAIISDSLLHEVAFYNKEFYVNFPYTMSKNNLYILCTLSFWKVTQLHVNRLSKYNN